LLLATVALGAPLACDEDGGSAGAGGAASGGKAGASKGGSAGKGNAGGAGAGNGGRAGSGKGGSAGLQAGAGAGGESAGVAGEAGAGVGGEGGVAGQAGEAGTAGGGAAAGAGEGGEGGAAGGTTSVEISAAEWALLEALSPLPALPADTTNAYADRADAAEFGQKLFFDPSFAGPLVALEGAAVNDLGAAGESEKVACSSCHLSPVMSDDRSPRADGSRPANVSLGTNFHTRNAPALVNSSFYAWTNWGGRFSAQWELPMPVTESALIMNSSRLRVAHVIFEKYKADYEAVFGEAYGPLEPALGTDLARFPATGKPKANDAAVDGVWEGMADGDRTIVNRIFVNYGKALAAYTRKLVSRNAPFDRFVSQKDNAISASAQRGSKLFVGKAGCVQCHGGPHLSDGGFHNLGVPQTGDHVPATDDGRFNNAPQLLTAAFSAASTTWSDDPAAGAARQAGITNPMPDVTKAAFRTPSLRGVADSAPYMHSGQLATLADVVAFYNDGGGAAAAGSTKSPAVVPLNLSANERLDLIAFLQTLGGDPVPAEWLESP
jgi:cytochrome c peroxidase